MQEVSLSLALPGRGLLHEWISVQPYELSITRTVIQELLSCSESLWYKWTGENKSNKGSSTWPPSLELSNRFVKTDWRWIFYQFYIMLCIFYEEELNFACRGNRYLEYKHGMRAVRKTDEIQFLSPFSVVHSIFSPSFSRKVHRSLP